MHGVFFAAAGVALVSCVVLMFMKEIPLQDEPAPTLEPITLDALTAESEWDQAEVWEGAAQGVLRAGSGPPIGRPVSSKPNSHAATAAT